MLLACRPSWRAGRWRSAVHWRSPPGSAAGAGCRFVSIAGPDAAAVDVVARYVAADGHVSVVSSCDIYEFADGKLAAITSYAVELPSE